MCGDADAATTLVRPGIVTDRFPIRHTARIEDIDIPSVVQVESGGAPSAPPHVNAGLLLRVCPRRLVHWLRNRRGRLHLGQMAPTADVEVRLFSVLCDIETFGSSVADARNGMTRPISLSRMKLTTPL